MRYIKHSNTSWTVILEGSHSFTSEHPMYNTLIEAMKNDDKAKFLQNIAIKDAYENWSYGDLTIQGDKVFFRGSELNQSLTDTFIRLVKEGGSYKTFARFIYNIKSNPNPESVEELYTWLLHGSFILTPEGTFLGYKSVAISNKEFVDKYGRQVLKGDYIDHHSKSIRNNPGDINEMPRHEVDGDRRKDCSSGFHIGTLGYAQSFHAGSTIMLCEVNPKHVVSVPEDSSCTKLRTCEYKIIGQME